MTDRSQKVREPKDLNPLPANHPKYERVKDLSTGAFGFVQLCRNKRSGQLVAIKFLERVSHIEFSRRDGYAAALNIPEGIISSFIYCASTTGFGLSQAIRGTIATLLLPDKCTLLGTALDLMKGDSIFERRKARRAL